MSANYNIVLEVLRLIGSWLCFASISFHVGTTGLAQPQKEWVSKVATAGWLLMTLYYILSLSDMILTWGESIIV